MTRPAVSVVLPVRNGVPYLQRAIDSVLQQSWTNLELIVIDDGSTDGTRDCLQRIDDPRVRLLETGGAGLAAALNAGLEAARAPWLARQDADDWSDRDRLDRQLAWLATHRDVDVLATAVTFVDASDHPVHDAWTRQVHTQWDAAVTPEAIASLLPLTCCLFHATIVARTDALRRAGGYDPAMVPAEDYDLWLRMLPAARFARLADPLYTVRVHAASSSTVRRADQLERVIAAKLRYLRRVVPGLPDEPRLALPCDDRGAAAYRRVAPVERFTVSADPGFDAGAPIDLVAVTAFPELDRYEARLRDRFHRVGNVFVRCDLMTGGKCGVEPARADLEAETAADRC